MRTLDRVLVAVTVTCALLATAAAVARAEPKGTVQGTVTGASSGTVTFTLQGTSFGQQTQIGGNGGYSKDLDPGTYSVAATVPGKTCDGPFLQTVVGDHSHVVNFSCD